MIAASKPAWRALRMRQAIKDTVPKAIRHMMAIAYVRRAWLHKTFKDAGAPCPWWGYGRSMRKYRPDYMADAVRAIDAYMAQLACGSCALANKPQITQPIDFIGGRCRVRTCDLAV
ncbi:integrase [Xylella fastidiosa]|uniref:integrase n=1 Tax=Xylella fastidiosa TaxID=2371 RepID=UPI003984711B